MLITQTHALVMLRVIMVLLLLSSLTIISGIKVVMVDNADGFFSGLAKVSTAKTCYKRVPAVVVAGEPLQVSHA